MDYADDKAPLALKTEVILDNGKARSDFITLTTAEIYGYKIVRYLGVKTGQTVLGVGLLSGVSSVVSSTIGVESKSIENKIAAANKASLEKLYQNCKEAGANAVINVNCQMMTIGIDIIITSATGTAVIVEKE